VIDVSGHFDENLPQASYPKSLESSGVLRMHCEDEVTGDLVIPWIGTVKAFIEELELGEKNTVRSGLSFRAKFVEDWDWMFPIQAFIQVEQTKMDGAFKNFQDQGYHADIFSKIAAGVGSVLGIRDQFQLYSALVQSKLGYLESLFREADALATELSDPKNLLGLDAFQNLWASVRKFSADIADKGAEFKYWVTPTVMTLQQVAAAIKVQPIDLLGLNVIEDSTAIKAGTRIRYYLPG
jgi:hypothetical protein